MRRSALLLASIALALLLASGVVEAFVTPSGLPTAARIGIGVLAEAGFVAYVLWGVVLVRRHGDTAPALADLTADRRCAEPLVARAG